MILISKFLIPKGYAGLTIYPFVFLKYESSKEDITLINHERIHLKQQLELLILPFYVFYVLEFLFRLMQYRNWYLAYINISFEREAYANETNLKYLKSRNNWHFLKYLRKDEKSDSIREKF